MIIVAGEALFDLFVTPSGFSPVIGGSPLNVAQGLARMGVKTAFLGGISSDFLGEKLMRFIEDEGIETRFISRFSKPTTLSFINVNDNGVPDYAFYGENAADRALVDAPSMTGVSALHIGSYSMVVNPFCETLTRLIKSCYRQIYVAYDPNIRLNVEPNVDVWRLKIAELAPFLSLLKMSDEDFAHLYMGQSFADVAHVLNVPLLVITKGAAGCEAFTPAHHVSLRGKSVSVIDTVGAGDTFQAAMLTYLHENNALTPLYKDYSREFLESMLCFAINAAAITCTRKGADLPKRQEL
jgi:fructokinase